MEITLNQALNFGQLLALILGGIWAVFKIGRWFGELTGSIKDVLNKHEVRLDEHDQRITRLEPAPRRGTDAA